MRSRWKPSCGGSERVSDPIRADVAVGEHRSGMMAAAATPDGERYVGVVGWGRSLERAVRDGHSLEHAAVGDDERPPVGAGAR